MTLCKWSCENSKVNVVFVMKVPYTKRISASTFSLSQLTVTTIPAVKSSSVSLIICVGAILVFCSWGNNAFDGCLLVCLRNNLMVMITCK